MSQGMQLSNQPLGGKVAIVTGAGRGIGKGIALAYAKAGAAVCCVARTAADIEQTTQEILLAGGQALPIAADVAQPAAVQQMVQIAVETFGGLDIMVINAGLGGDRRSVETSSPDLWRNTIEVNLLGAYFCAQAAIPALRQRGEGKIITLGSGLGHRGKAGRSDYACSKAGLWMLTRVLAQELRPDNISVNEIIPGPVRTDMTARFQAALRLDPSLGSGGEWFKTPDDLVPLAMFLATQPTMGPSGQSFSLRRADD